MNSTALTLQPHKFCFDFRYLRASHLLTIFNNYNYNYNSLYVLSYYLVLKDLGNN